MFELFVPDSEADEVRNLRIRAAVAQCCFQVPFAPGEEAGPQLAVRRYADPVAARTERLRHGVDEAELALPVREAEPPGRRRRLRRHLDERAVACLEQRPDPGARQDLVGA